MTRKTIWIHPVLYLQQEGLPIEFDGTLLLAMLLIILFRSEWRNHGVQGSVTRKTRPYDPTCDQASVGEGQECQQMWKMQGSILVNQAKG